MTGSLCVRVCVCAYVCVHSSASEIELEMDKCFVYSER